MPRSRKPIRRADLSRFWLEIEPPTEFDSDEDRKLWEKAEKGELPLTPFEVLDRIEANVQNDQTLPDDIKSGTFAAIGKCREYLNAAPPPTSDVLENSFGGLAWLIAYSFYALAREYELAKLEFGEIGNLYRQALDAKEYRSEGGRVRAAAIEARDRQIAFRLRHKLSTGSSYSLAITSVVRLWPEEWGPKLSAKSIRNKFPRKNFPVPHHSGKTSS